MEFLIVTAAVMGIPFVLFGMSGWSKLEPRPMHCNTPVGWPEWLNPWRLVIALVLAGLLFAALDSGPRDRSFFLSFTALIVLALVLRAWRHEFLFLMGRRDDDFPGRYDKLVWVFMLTAFAPVGLWFFRSYHLAHWPEPEPKPQPDHARTAPEAL